MPAKHGIEPQYHEVSYRIRANVTVIYDKRPIDECGKCNRLYEHDLLSHATYRTAYERRMMEMVNNLEQLSLLQFAFVSGT